MKRKDQVDALVLEMERIVDTATTESRDLSESEQARFNDLRAKVTKAMDDDVEAPTNPTRAVGAPAVHTRKRATVAGLLRGALALACGERGVDTGMAHEFDQEVRRRNPHREFAGVAFSAKALLVSKAVSALTGQNAAATTGDQWLDSLFFRTDDAIAGPRLAAALGVNTIAATEERLHIAKMEGRVVPGWIARDGDVPDSDASFDAIEVTPKSIGCNVLVKRSALLYGTHPQVEPLLMQDLRDAVLDELDRATLFGSGAGNEPTGVAEVAQAGHSLTSLSDAFLVRSQLLNYQKNLAGMKWLLPDLTEGKLATTAAFSGATSPIVMGGTLAGFEYVLRPLSMSGSPTPSAEYLAGNWSHVHLILWDSISLLANPYGAGYKSGSVELRVIADANVLVRDEKRLFIGSAATLAF